MCGSSLQHACSHIALVTVAEQRYRGNLASFFFYRILKAPFTHSRLECEGMKDQQVEKWSLKLFRDMIESI